MGACCSVTAAAVVEKASIDEAFLELKECQPDTGAPMDAAAALQVAGLVRTLGKLCLRYCPDIPNLIPLPVHKKLPTGTWPCHLKQVYLHHTQQMEVNAGA